MTTLHLIQMSGAPGVGKSTMARLIGRRIGAVILDHDVTKTALLESGIAWDVAGRVSYDILFTLAEAVLGQGLSVILDSPCFYRRILDEGQQIAARTGSEYRYIECVLTDMAEIDRRLRGRVPSRSQRRGLSLSPVDAVGDPELRGEELYRAWLRNIQRPEHSYLQVDTAQPENTCFDTIIAFLGAPQGAVESAKTRRDK